MKRHISQGNVALFLSDDKLSASSHIAITHQRLAEVLERPIAQLAHTLTRKGHGSRNFVKRKLLSANSVIHSDHHGITRAILSSALLTSCRFDDSSHAGCSDKSSTSSKRFSFLPPYATDSQGQTDTLKSNRRRMW